MTLPLDLSAPPNLAEYADPELYDLENPAFAPGSAFFLALAQEVGGPVLELGCGTGRFVIPLARQGIDVAGLDVMPGMLARARQKSLDLPIQWIEADARTFQVNRQFRLIFDYAAAFLHLLDRADHEAVLARVRAHLAPGGWFVLVNTFFQPTLMVDQAEHDWFTYTDRQGREVRVSGTLRYDLVRQIYHEDAVRRWHTADGEVVERYAPLARRFLFAPELEALFHYNGFQVRHRYGNWDRSPLTDDSPLMIYVCAVRA
jgi:trans-aconitate methyltransferase